MNINEAYLSELSDSQIAFSSAFLEDVFLHQKTGLSQFRPDDISTICTLIKSVPSKAMKSALLKALDTPFQVQIAQKMDDKELHFMFLYHDDIPILKLIFQSLTDNRKESVIQMLFKDDKKKFNELKPLMESSRTVATHAPATLSPEDLTKAIQHEIKVMLKLITDPKYTASDLKDRVTSAEKRIPLDHFEVISRRVIAEFTRLNIPLSNKDTFAVHVKFYTFLVPYLVLFPNLNTVVLHPLDAFLHALNRLPNGVWVIKVLNQLPYSIIELCLDRLKSHPRIPELQKRSVYSKLLNVIYENAHIQEGAQIRTILEG